MKDWFAIKKPVRSIIVILSIIIPPFNVYGYSSMMFWAIVFEGGQVISCLFSEMIKLISLNGLLVNKRICFLECKLFALRLDPLMGGRQKW